MRLLHWLDYWLASLERALVVLLLTGLLGLGLLQVIERNVLASGIFWADELLQHIVLWLGFLGASLATREHRHLSIDVLSHVLPVRLQVWLELLVNIVAFVLCMLLVQAAWGLVRSEYTAGTMLTFGVPAWLAQSIIPLGFGAITLRFALRLMETLARLLQPEAGA
jgi:TRAP-type C4-dicarboxylate transport system permease small subunit